MSWWIDRQKNDPFVKKRNKQNVVSRAYFKIEEIQNKFSIIKQNNFILDLGAAPGGWSQFFVKFSKNVYAIDILDNFLISGVNFLCADIFNEQAIENLPMFEVICSDMAPNFSGHKFLDQMQTLAFCDQALKISGKLLKPHGNLVVKAFEGEGFDSFLQNVKKTFKNVTIFKPISSRNESKEKYIVCKHFFSLL